MPATIPASRVVTIAIRREIPAKGGWPRDQHCRVLAGCYETGGPARREVYVPEQVGRIQGWAFCEWDGTTALAVRLYVAVVTAG